MNFKVALVCMYVSVMDLSYEKDYTHTHTHMYTYTLHITLQIPHSPVWMSSKQFQRLQISEILHTHRQKPGIRAHSFTEGDGAHRGPAPLREEGLTTLAVFSSVWGRYCSRGIRYYFCLPSAVRGLSTCRCLRNVCSIND